jgi:hypothetical protein
MWECADCASQEARVKVVGWKVPRGVEVVKGTVSLVKCDIANPNNTGVMKREGALVVQECKIHGCEDGILNQGGSLHVYNTTIENCSSDGIFSNDHVIVDTCVIRRIGRHGIKSRGGAERRGKNDIQPSPWD